jgi:hypothetical protein
VLAFESLGPETEFRAVSGAPEDRFERPDILSELFARARRPRPDEALTFLDKIEVQLAKRLALDLGIHDSQVVLAVVRSRYVGIWAAAHLFRSCRPELTADEYDTLRDYTQAELIRWPGRSGGGASSK